MKRMLALVLCAGLMTGCSALPAEERSFAVALAVSVENGRWTAAARIPTYQSGGGYATVRGEGASFEGALAAMDAASPMQLHLGQLRLIVFSEVAGRSNELPAMMRMLAQRPDVRSDCCIGVTAEEPDALMEAMKPSTGARLSKSLDVLIESRAAQGSVLPTTLAEAVLMGERQSPVLMNVRVQEGAVDVAGGWPVSAEGRVAGQLTAEEVQLLALMAGRLKSGTLSLQEGTVRITDVHASAELSMPVMQSAAVRLILRTGTSPLTEEALSQAIARACLGVLNQLSGMGCDALGLGRQAVLHVSDIQEWNALAWPARYREMVWSVSVGAQPEA